MSDMGPFFAELILATGDFLLLLWPISAAVLVAAVLGLLFPSPRLKSYFGRGLPALAVSYLFPFGVMVVGFLLRYDGPPHPNWRQPPEWRGYVLYLPILLHIVFVVGTLVVLKGRRVRAGALLVPGLWLSLCALPPAGFAIAGVGP